MSHEVLEAPSTPRRHWSTRAGELAVGLSANWAICYGFDYVLYPAVIWWMGLIRGGIVMTLLSFLACLLTLWFYDWTKRDWLGIEALKGLREYRGNSRFRRIIGSVLRLGDIPAAVLLSMWYDPFITMIYIRKGQYNGMGRRDWNVFLISWLVGNSGWAITCWLGVSGLEWLWHTWGGK